MVIVIAPIALAIWQWDEYGHERDLTREAVSSSAESIMNALVGGIRSHRRLGHFFVQNVQGVLEGLAESHQVVAVALQSEDGKKSLSAGKEELIAADLPFQSGGRWVGSGFCLVRVFALPESDGPGHDGFGGGRGPGWWRQQEERESGQSMFAAGERVAAVLLIDREPADEASRRAALLRGSIVAAGTLVIVCVAVAWRATVRLTQLRERERSLELEARHYRDLSQAAAGLAHEIRNPLGLIRGWTQRFAQAGSGPQQAEAVIEECDRITARINQFLAFARTTEPKVESFDPAEVHQELAELLAPDTTAKRVEFVLGPSVGKILADREMYRQALFNFLNNAIQASPEGGTVEVIVRRPRADQFRVEVSDRGKGVEPENVERLFTPYFTTRACGTGLGLAITRRIAAVHGWTVGYHPRGGGGSVFWVDGIDG